MTEINGYFFEWQNSDKSGSQSPMISTDIPVAKSIAETDFISVVPLVVYEHEEHILQINYFHINSPCIE